MSEQSSQEPTMEEILASIRRIISEDDAPPADAKATPPHAEQPPTPVQPEPEPEPEPVAEAAPVEDIAPPPATARTPPAPLAEDDDDALELTDKVETHGDLDVYTPTAPERAAPLAAAAPAAPLVSDRVASAAASAFDRLSQTIAMPAEGRTLEDVVRELLRPLLQQWLDDNLPGIVQQAVEAEVERIARGRVR
ncbi:DUF2497 domain-containing protein [Phenylobacterium sp.]|jgi:cell pole-organizing protein PopZ|uniref:DUF2497 domain-containing protein n=1 Tax=Phenylobacterium sp. TaxID=1871053 RepID=UPI002F951A75